MPRVKFRRMDFESECAYDCINNRGFLITEPPFSDADKQIRNFNGPRSSRYGTSWDDNNSFAERWRCQCGRTIGAAFVDEICQHCHTPVKDRDIDILYTGYISLGKYKIINPLYYHALQSALSKKILEGIISNENIITPQGIIRKHNEAIEVKKSNLIYWNIGLNEYYNHYEEIMEYYKNKRKQKADLIQRLIDDKDKVWTSKIPVYSTALRPFGVTTESIYFTGIEKHINPLTNISINLKRATPIEIPLYLYQTQMRVNELWEMNFGLIDSKYGWIRARAIGGEFNFSGRSVIVLDPTLKINEIDMPYKAFLEQYRGHIIREICKDKGWTVTKASNFIAMKINYDPYVYSIMCRLVERGVQLILNRNPGKSRGCKNPTNCGNTLRALITKHRQ